MRIVHRVSLHATPEVVAELAAAGIAAGTGLQTFEIAESDPRWPRVAELVERHEAVDLVRTDFTARECEQAPALQLIPTWHHGYPMPDEDEGYLSATFDLAEYCASCGIGLRQKAPFRMIREPRWGVRSILQLNWVFDAFFVTPSLWRAAFEPAGIGARPVLDERGTRELSTVVQLDIPSIAPVSGLPSQGSPCVACGRRKHLPWVRGPFPPVDLGGGHAVKTNAWFGSGASAWRAIVISGDLYRRLRALRVRGVGFVPVAADVRSFVRRVRA